MNYQESIKVWNSYLTRKDWRHYNRIFLGGNGKLKSWRKEANGYVRRYKGEITDGGMYKKIFDVQWNVW